MQCGRVTDTENTPVLKGEIYNKYKCKTISLSLLLLVQGDVSRYLASRTKRGDAGQVGRGTDVWGRVEGVSSF